MIELQVANKKAGGENGFGFRPRPGLGENQETGLIGGRLLSHAIFHVAFVTGLELG